MSDNIEEYKFKIVLLGDGAVGKTSLVRKFVKNIFDEDYRATLGTNVYLKNVLVKQGDETVKVTFSIWDVLGQRSYKHIIKGSLKGTSGIFFVTDLTNRDSLLNLEQWLSTVYEHLERPSFVFLGNKTDLPDRKFGLSELNQTAEAFHSPAFLTSALTGENVEVAFGTLAVRILNQMYGPSKDDVLFPEFSNEVNPRVMASDRMIDMFCEELGGYERVMPITRIVFKNLAIDFTNPSNEDIKHLLEHFVDITRDEKGPTVADQLDKRMQTVLEGLE